MVLTSHHALITQSMALCTAHSHSSPKTDLKYLHEWKVRDSNEWQAESKGSSCADYMPKCGTVLVTLQKKKKKKKSWLAESDWRVCQKFIKRILSESVKDSRSIPQSNSPLCFQTSSDERTVSMHATTSHAASDFKENEGTSDITVHWLVGWHIQVNYKDNFFFFPLFYRAHTCTGEWTVTSGGIKLPSGDPV